MAYTTVSKAALNAACAIVIGGASFMPGVAEPATFPAPLLGKSVTMTWSVNRHVAYDGNVAISNQTQVVTLRIYISTAARAFSKQTTVTGTSIGGIHGAKRYGGSNHENRAPDDDRGSGRGVNVVHMDGSNLVVDRQMVEGAQRVSVTFDAAYGSCNARVIYGREGGVGAIRGINHSTGNRYEVLSIQASTPSCEVTSGNVVGD
jgi:hypothetical protein